MRRFGKTNKDVGCDETPTGHRNALHHPENQSRGETGKTIKGWKEKRLAVCKRLETGSVSKRFLRFSISENNDPWQGYTGVGQDLNLVVKSDRWKDLNIPVYTHSLFPTQL